MPPPRVYEAPSPRSGRKSSGIGIQLNLRIRVGGAERFFKLQGAPAKKLALEAMTEEEVEARKQSWQDPPGQPGDDGGGDHGGDEDHLGDHSGDQPGEDPQDPPVDYDDDDADNADEEEG